jgi:heme oxygenase (biliverdin-producing, ferredoxin)
VPEIPLSLPERLKAETRALHLRAERSGTMAALLGRRLARPAYGRLLHNLHALYAALEPALEAALQRRPDPALATMLPVLRRQPALAADLAALGLDAGNPAPGVLQPALAEYVQRLERDRASAPHRLLAHAYVRYLGDLHGGQILAARVRDALGLAAGVGTAFYAFGDDARVQQLRLDFRTWLAALTLSPGEGDDLVDEAVWAFGAHCRLFEQIEAAT